MSKSTATTPNLELLSPAEQFLGAVKLKHPVGLILKQLQSFSLKHLQTLEDDAQRKAFWINLYNAWFQVLVERKIPRREIFTAHPFQFANLALSLDEMEHGILRKLKPHPSKGEPVLYPLAVQQLALEKEDYRIHFALSCGQKSCPPIAFYHAANLDKELDLATLAYLSEETLYDPIRMEVCVNELLRWYADDFGGESGILKLLASIQLIPEDKGLTLHFKEYNRETTIRNFRN